MIKQVPTMKELWAKQLEPEVLFWVGCAGSFDQQAKEVTRRFVHLLHKANIRFAVLGIEENCTGDPAKRSGNEFLFQMQALTNIQTLNTYRVKNIVTTCPHCFNTLKNEYPSLGGNYKVQHHTAFLSELLAKGRLKIQGKKFKGKVITYHDPCYLARSNGIYEAPRKLMKQLDVSLVEMQNNRKNTNCCGAGGAQVFKEPEKGQTQINQNRADQIKQTKAEILCTACPFCNIMLKEPLQSSKIQVLDIAQLLD